MGKKTREDSSVNREEYNSEVESDKSHRED